MKVSRIKDDLLWGFFAKIDTDNDGLISFNQYLHWLKTFLCPATFSTDAFYFELDDMASAHGNHLITSEVDIPKK